VSAQLAMGAALGGERDAELEAVVIRTLEEARRAGATSAEAAASRGAGLSVTARMNEVETIEHHRDKEIVVTVYFGNRTGSASSSDYSEAAVRDTVRAACSIARYTAEDECAGLADAADLAREIPALDLSHPWDLTAERAIEIARACEAAALAEDARIVNSEGATVNTHGGIECYGNTHGFLACLAGTRHGLSCSVLGEAEGAMQRDYWFTAARDARLLEEAAQVGRTAARRTLRRLGARRLGTRQAPVLFEAPVAGSLLSHFVSAVRGGSLYRKASFLLDKLGEPVFAPLVRIHEQPHLRGALGSAPFDDDGVATRARDLVTGGVLTGYVLDAYSARKLKLNNTGNAGGVRNLTLDPGAQDFAALLKQMGTGLLVTELIGFGVNTVTGDYSRGAVGFWVEGGEIRYPVDEITIAGNLKDIYKRIAAIGNDVDTRGNTRCGSILVESLTIAGS
jgi:PmbA protein